MLPVEAGARQAAIRSKQGLAQGAGGASDHLALVKAFNGWSAARRGGQERGYCASNFLSSSTMMMVDGMRSQLLGELQVRAALGFYSCLGVLLVVFGHGFWLWCFITDFGRGLLVQNLTLMCERMCPDLLSLACAAY